MTIHAVANGREGCKGLPLIVPSAVVNSMLAG